MIKIVRIDNYARETVADGLVALVYGSKAEVSTMLEALQTKREGSSVWYATRRSDYRRICRAIGDLVGDDECDAFVDQEIGS